MKRKITVLFLLAGLIVIPATAQDFTSPKIQFLSFNFGVPVGYDLETKDMIAGSNFGIGFAVIDNLTVAYDNIATAVGNAASLLRLSFSFSDKFGGALSFGGNKTVTYACLGVYGNFFQARAASGLAYGLGLRLDYLTRTDDFGKGKALFIINASFGL
ncbi:MAG: hypothetical protein LBH43_13155 [Treponema sp.]|nr:hypothetical protein [Treponema sp.]